MLVKKAVRSIMEKKGVGTGALAEMLGKPSRLVCDRLSLDKGTNLSIDKLDELVSVLGYKIVLMPADEEVRDGWYEVEDSRTSEEGGHKDGEG